VAERNLILSFDCDDILVETVPKVLRYYNKTYDAKVKIAHYYSDPEFWDVSDFNIINSRVVKYLEEFGHQELLVPYPEAVKGMNRVKKMGYKSLLTTARSDFMTPVTEAMVETFFPGCFDEIIHTNGYNENARSKGAVCAERNVDVHIDDHIEHCNSVIDHGVPNAILRTRAWNRDEILRPGITRCKNFPGIIREVVKIAQY
jgi:phosphoglycolate phosphatase-like HAD superfamily hydrolase